ncbi:proline reductase-associated electron transfer protein PrdC [Johnsonella ignava]|uniref:proline reductase-associated electron transfer protein PrdC n=1 Tax=Johnsonella ignava TaxID=43995 RepID=UPI0023F31701|nr:proline reductase-associated electron transfer protein PrdC [Johnsonella ignava]
MKFVFPLKQHIGAASESIVVPKEHVHRGQLIAKRPETSLGANIFSSVDGTVDSVSETEIIINEENTDFSKYESLKEIEPIKLVEESGLVGLGGAGFPTYLKLGKKFESGGVIAVNAAECEPILSHNIYRIEKEPQKLIDGLKIVLEITNAGKGIICLKGIHTEAIKILKNTIKDPNISIFELENIYPVGEERAIVRDALGVLLDPELLPLAADAIVINAETVFRLREAVVEKKPLIDKDITVAGKLKENASIHILQDIPLGKSVGEVIDTAGGLGHEYGEIIMGGPFTGKRTTLDAPIVKTTGGIIAAENFMPGPQKIGLLVCACGADKERLEEQAASMGSEVVGVKYCKQAKQVKNSLKCENPGKCPGQVEKVMALKKAGAQAVLISNCTDCTNTVMSCAPQLKLPVYHCTDGALRSVNYKMIRKFKN